MAQARVNLPQSGISIAGALAHLEVVSRAIHESFRQDVSADSQTARLEAYEQFRADAFSLLGHYVELGLQDAFRWLLLINDAAPRRIRIALEDNPFHWGLLAMTSAARSVDPTARRWKPFMSSNKLRDLGSLMKLAHAKGIEVAGLEEFIANQRKLQHREALRRKLRAIREERAGLGSTPRLPLRMRRARARRRPQR
jgi:hypothetical protein